MNTSIKLGVLKEICFSAGSNTYTRKALVRNIQHYDDKERIIKDISSKQVIEFEYYGNGQKKKEEYHHDGAAVLRFDYDEYGNLIKSSNADGVIEEPVSEKSTKEYDGHGRIILFKNGERERSYAYDSKGRKIFEGTNQGESNYCVYSDDEKFKLLRYSNAEESFETIVETVSENGKKVMCIMYAVIK